LIKIRENPALFSLIGNLYGGDGKEDFALPDLRGRIVIAAAPDNGTSTYDVGPSPSADETSRSYRDRR
jgi:microcystin-dependent protein